MYVYSNNGIWNLYKRREQDDSTRYNILIAETTRISVRINIINIEMYVSLSWLGKMEPAPTHASNIKRTVLVRNQNIHSPLPMMWKASNTTGFTMCEFWHLESHPFSTTLDIQLSLYRPLCYNSRAHCLYCSVYVLQVLY